MVIRFFSILAVLLVPAMALGRDWQPLIEVARSVLAGEALDTLSADSITPDKNELERLAELGRMRRRAVEEAGIQITASLVNVPDFFAGYDEISEFLDRLAESKEMETAGYFEAPHGDAAVEYVLAAASMAAGSLEANGCYLEAYEIFVGPMSNLDPCGPMKEWAQRLLAKIKMAEAIEMRWLGVHTVFDGASIAGFESCLERLAIGYVEIPDWYRMAIGGLRWCKMLLEVHEAAVGCAPGEYDGCWTRALGEMEDELADLMAGTDDGGLLIDAIELVLEETAASGLSPEAIVWAFAEGALRQLDPYTRIYWPGGDEDLEKALGGRFAGIGVRLTGDRGLVRISEVLDGTPACRKGLNRAEVIASVDGFVLDGVSPALAAQLVSGSAGTQVTLEVISTSDESRFVTVERELIEVPNIFGWSEDPENGPRYLLDQKSGVGYIRLGLFEDGTFEKFSKAISKIEPGPLRALIIDLRGCPGGLLSCATDIAEEFMEEGMILRTQPRFGMPHYICVERPGRFSAVAVVVLVDRHTASAAEVVAAVLSDPACRRAIVIGERTFGKGSVQSIMERDRSAVIKYTAAHYYTPSGFRVKSRHESLMECDDDWGIQPDIEINLTLSEFIDLRRGWRGGSCGGGGAIEESAAAREMLLAADPQLEAALMVARLMVGADRDEEVQESSTSTR
jgi:carboxyl-terminal processing protease